MKTAFVLSGGGSLGAVHVGMLQALAEVGERPELVVGTSVGALNAVAYAAEPTVKGLAGLERIWRGLRSTDVFPVSPLQTGLALVGRSDHLVSDRGLRRLLDKHLRLERLEHARIPVRVVATGLASGRELVLGEGSAADAVRASAAIPGVFPPVDLGVERAVDGGVVSNSPLMVAVKAGCSRVVVLSTSLTCRGEERPASALGVAMQALNLLIGRQLVEDVRRLKERGLAVDLRVVPPLCPIPVLPSDFSRSGWMIDRSLGLTRQWLADGGLTRDPLPPEWEAEACLAGC